MNQWLIAWGIDNEVQMVAICSDKDEGEAIQAQILKETGCRSCVITAESIWHALHEVGELEIIEETD